MSGKETKDYWSECGQIFFLDGEYNVQRKLLQDALDSLIIPEADAALNAGELLESLGLIWEKATLEEKHRLLAGMLEAVYVDLAVSHSVVGIQPKPPFYPLFKSLKHKPESKVMIFRPGGKEKLTGSGLISEPDFGLGGDGGESNSPSRRDDPEYATSLVSSLILSG